MIKVGGKKYLVDPMPGSDDYAHDELQNGLDQGLIVPIDVNEGFSGAAEDRKAVETKPKIKLPESAIEPAISEFSTAIRDGYGIEEVGPDIEQANGNIYRHYYTDDDDLGAQMSVQGDYEHYFWQMAKVGWDGMISADEKLDFDCDPGNYFNDRNGSIYVPDKLINKAVNNIRSRMEMGKFALYEIVEPVDNEVQAWIDRSDGLDFYPYEIHYIIYTSQLHREALCEEIEKVAKEEYDHFTEMVEVAKDIQQQGVVWSHNEALLTVEDILRMGNETLARYVKIRQGYGEEAAMRIVLALAQQNALS